MGELAFLAVIVVDGVEQLLVEVNPLLESELFTEHARGNVTRYQGGFDGDGSRTTHRVYQVTFTFPAGHQYHSGGQDLVQRSFHRFLAVTAAVQGFTAGVERKCTLSFGNMDVQQHVGLVDTHAGTFAALLAEVVHDGILYLIGYELGMAELFAEYDGIYGKGLVCV